MNLIRERKETVLVCVFIGCGFWATSEGYLNWLYRVMDFYDSTWTDFLTEVVGYLFQAVGICAYMLLNKRELIKGKQSMDGHIMMMSFVTMIFAVRMGNAVGVLIAGYVMNVFLGAFAAIYIKALAGFVPTSYRAIAFGGGYAFSCFGSWIISINESKHMATTRLMVAGFLIIMCTYVYQSILELEPCAASEEKEQKTSLVALLALVVLLLSGVKSIGFFFPMADLSDGAISMEFSRAFYGIGLIAAGLVADYNRRYSGILCLSALVFPFMMVFTIQNVGTSTIMWILGYITFGFVAVYRVIVFADLARQRGALYLAPLGLMWGRVGDAIGNGLGIWLKDYTMAIIWSSGVAFAVTIIVYFYVYNKLYTVPENVDMNLAEDSNTDSVKAFEKKYDLSRRERQVLKLVLDGRSNSEIASELFVSESTIKFHMRNLLKKTECKNRIELIDLVEK